MLPLVASSGLIPPAASFCIYKGEAKRQGSLKKGPIGKDKLLPTGPSRWAKLFSIRNQYIMFSITMQEKN
jgi:hypothetical protein